MKILDVSKYQPNIDYAAAAKQIDGVILRCGYTGYGSANECNTDPCFEKHYAGFKAAGVPVGAYYYSAADTVDKVREEAEYCKQLLAGKRFELPIYYDVECTQRMESLTKDQLTEQIITWCEAMEQAGYFVGVYSYTAFFQTKLHIDQISRSYTIWLADYRQNYDRTIPRDMHQYTSAANIGGVAGGVDMSTLFRSDLPSLIANGGFNGFEGETEVPVVPLYHVTFGAASAGDKNAAVCLGEKMGLAVTADDAGGGLYMVTYSPMTAGDKLAIQQLGEQLAVPVTVSEV